MGPAEGGFDELLVDIVEDCAWVEEELAQDHISASQAAVWFSCPLGEDCAASARSWFSVVKQERTAQVSLARTTPRDNRDFGLDDVLSKRRWLPARVLARSSLPRDATPAADDSKERNKDASRTHKCCCSVVLSPCLAEALGFPPASAHDPINNSTSTSAARRTLWVKAQQLCVRELPSSLVALASAVELRGPYPVSAATGRLDAFGGNSGGQASKPAQQQVQLAAVVSSILPFALDEQVLAEGSVVRVAGLFGLIVTRVRAEDERRGGRVAKDGGAEAGRSLSSTSTGHVMVRVHGSTELRVSPPTRSGRVGVAVDRNSSPLRPVDSSGFGDWDADGGGDRGATAGSLTPRSSRSWQQSRPGHDDKAASTAAPSSVLGACALSPSSPPYSSLDAGEWIRRVKQDFGGFENQIETAITAAGTTLRGGGKGRHHGRGGELTAPASGLLLHGPTGVGKTLLARYVEYPKSSNTRVTTMPLFIV